MHTEHKLCMPLRASSVLNGPSMELELELISAKIERSRTYTFTAGAGHHQKLFWCSVARINGTPLILAIQSVLRRSVASSCGYQHSKLATQLGHSLSSKHYKQLLYQVMLQGLN